MRVRQYSNNSLDYLLRGLSTLDRKLLFLENRRVPTCPRANPVDRVIGIEGQLIIGSDDKMYRWRNGEWKDTNAPT